MTIFTYSISKKTMPKSQKETSSHKRNRNLAIDNRKALDLLALAVEEARRSQNEYYKQLKQLLGLRKKATQMMPTSEIETVMDVFEIGPKALEGWHEFMRWLNYPSLSFGGKTPLKLLLAKKAKYVRDVLYKIEYGIY